MQLFLFFMLQGGSVGNLAFYLHTGSQGTQGSYASGGGSASTFGSHAGNGSGGILSGAREATGYNGTSSSQYQSGRLRAGPCKPAPVRELHVPGSGSACQQPFRRVQT